MESVQPRLIHVVFSIFTYFTIFNLIIFRRRLYLRQNHFLILFLKRLDISMVLDAHIFYISQFYPKSKLFCFSDKILSFKHLFMSTQLLCYFRVRAKLIFGLFKSPIENGFVDYVFREESVRP